MTNTTETLDERDEIELLLPWYVTGKLAPADHARVEGWLRKDTALAHQVSLIREDREAAIAVNEAVRLPASLSVETFMASLPPSRVSMADAGSGLLAQLARLFSAPTAGAVRFAAAAAIAVMLAQAVTIGTMMSSREPARYETASGQQPSALDGSFAIVRFADGATAKEIAATLAGLGMVIVDGPRPGGLFKVRIGDAALNEAGRSARIDQLKANSALVVLATPAP